VDYRVHPRAIVESDDIGCGTCIWANVHVMPGAKIGSNCNLCDGAFVEDGVVLGDNVTVKWGVLICDGVTIGNGVFLGPGVVFSNDRFPRSRRLSTAAKRYETNDWLEATQVGEGASIGAGAVILPGADVGAYAVVAAGSVVTRKVEAHTLVMGNPARMAGFVCVCGQRLSNTKDVDFHCDVCGRCYRLADDQLLPVDASR
jgi:acetyltransferase-like isoleucine patch superfamily enzyme